MNNRPWIGKLTHVSLFTILMSSQSLWNMWVVVSQVHMWKGARKLWKHAAVHFHTPQCHRWRCDIQPDFIPGVVIIANYYLVCLLWCHFLDNQPISVKRHSIILSCGTMYGDCLCNYYCLVLTQCLHSVFWYLIIRYSVRKVSSFILNVFVLSFTED